MHELKSVRKYKKTSNFSLKMFVSQSLLEIFR